MRRLPTALPEIASGSVYMPYVKEWFAKLPDLAAGGVTTARMEVLPDRITIERKRRQ